MPVDFDFVLYWVSLGISAAAVVLFVWLMRQSDRETGSGKRETTAENERR